MREPCKHCNSKDCDDRECDRLGPVGELACIRCSKAVDAVARRGPCGGRVIEPSDDTWRSEHARHGGRVWVCSVACARLCARDLSLLRFFQSTPCFQSLRVARARESDDEAEYNRALAEDRALRDACKVGQESPPRLNFGGLIDSLTGSRQQS